MRLPSVTRSPTTNGGAPARCNVTCAMCAGAVALCMHCLSEYSFHRAVASASPPSLRLTFF